MNQIVNCARNFENHLQLVDDVAERRSTRYEESIINSSWPCFCRFYFTAFHPSVRETKMKKKWPCVWVIYTCQRRFIARFMLHTRHPLKPTFACSGRSKNANWKTGTISFFRLAEGTVFPSVVLFIPEIYSVCVSSDFAGYEFRYLLL